MTWYNWLGCCILTLFCSLFLGVALRSVAEDIGWPETLGMLAVATLLISGIVMAALP